jgi:acyl dehydratase
MMDVESDFWKDEERRASWDEIEVGVERRARPVELTLEIIQTYARAIGDLNPLYFDAEYAKQTVFGGLIAPPTIHVPLLFLATEVTRFGEVIAHGLMTFSLVTRMLTVVVYALGGWHERCEMRFTAPVRAGDTVTTFGAVSHVRPIGGQLLYVAAVRAERQDATVVAIGDAMGRVPIG